VPTLTGRHPHRAIPGEELAVEPTATATVIGALKASPVVRRWVRQARSAGAEIWRPRKDLPTKQYVRVHEPLTSMPVRGLRIDLDTFERVDPSFGPAADETVVILASRTVDGACGATIAGLSGDEVVVLMSADELAWAGLSESGDSSADNDGAGSAWVALVSLAGRIRNVTAIGQAAGSDHDRPVTARTAHAAFAMGGNASGPEETMGWRPSL
jgi:hypothetical protein